MTTGGNISKASVFAAFVSIVLTAFFFYPKWEKPATEATISWDVMGYYLYLPSLFIYNDITELEFKDKILTKYNPTTSFYQGIQQEDGTYVMKYPIGASILYFPGFAIGHTYAELSQYPADGFSYPYQFGLSMWSLCVSLIGLLTIRHVLLKYFADLTTGVVILLLVLGTNYLNYTAIDHALTHNYLFTLYALLILTTIKWYEQPTYLKSIAIGGLVALATLTRPVEIISCTIPLIWGVFDKATLQNRLFTWNKNYKKILLSVGVVITIGMIQPIYWKMVSNQWLFYSYQEQGFSFLSPYLLKGLLSFRKGWLIYTPLMIFSLIGLYHLYQKKQELFYAISFFIIINIYIVFSWDIWWYGGSLGQRALIQSYSVLVFPLAAFVSWIYKKGGVYYSIYGLFLFCIWFNLTLTYQAHSGILDASNMTQAYFWKIFGKTSIDIEAKKLLDTDEEFRGVTKNVDTLLTYNYSPTPSANKISEKQHASPHSSLIVPPQGREQFNNIPVSDQQKNKDWLQAKANFYTPSREGHVWEMTQFRVRFSHQNKKVKERFIRLERLLLHEKQWKSIHINTQIPEDKFDTVTVEVRNLSEDKPIFVDDLVVETFNE